jgi:hypothetical protein
MERKEIGKFPLVLTPTFLLGRRDKTRGSDCDCEKGVSASVGKGKPNTTISTSTNTDPEPEMDYFHDVKMTEPLL